MDFVSFLPTVQHGEPETKTRSEDFQSRPEGKGELIEAWGSRGSKGSGAGELGAKGMFGERLEEGPR